MIVNNFWVGDGDIIENAVEQKDGHVEESNSIGSIKPRNKTHDESDNGPSGDDIEILSMQFHLLKLMPQNNLIIIWYSSLWLLSWKVQRWIIRHVGLVIIFNFWFASLMFKTCLFIGRYFQLSNATGRDPQVADVFNCFIDRMKSILSSELTLKNLLEVVSFCLTVEMSESHTSYLWNYFCVQFLSGFSNWVIFLLLLNW